MQWMKRFHKRLATPLGVLVLLMMLLIVIDVVGRYLFSRPLLGGVEISRVMLAWILFGSLAYSLSQDAHIRVTVLTRRFSPRVRFLSERITALLGLVFFALALYAGWDQFKLSYDVGEEMAAPIWIPFWISKLAVPVGCALIMIQLGLNLIAPFTSNQDKTP